jgi:phosphomannomutase
MVEATAAGAKCVVGYEANGGFLLNSDVNLGGKILRALPTRDAVIVMLGILMLAARQGKPVSGLTAALPARFTASDRLKNFPTEKSRQILARFSTPDETANRTAVETTFGELCGAVGSLDRTDGLRVTFDNAEIIHLRPSGNAPEFRCYTEAASIDRAEALNAATLKILERLAL